MALPVGSPAPQFMLPLLAGGEFDLHSTLAQGPVLLAFFKISCPVCQFTFPFLDRIYRTYGDKRVTIVGVSQNESRETQDFLKECGITFPVLLDDPSDYEVSNAFGLTNVPTLFWIEPNGRIGVEAVGWDKGAMERLNELVADFSKAPIAPLFRSDEKDIPAFRAG
ncbi:MAG: TlpA family protein disulfide reductase [Acidobacteriales bacterium]|nr:TlpA family protein disulfide reductase [Terriglobales bacterium]